MVSAFDRNSMLNMKASVLLGYCRHVVMLRDLFCHHSNFGQGDPIDIFYLKKKKKSYFEKISSIS